MADKEYESRIKITGDTSGAEKIGKAYEETGKKAEAAGKKAASGFDRARKAAGQFNKIISTLTNFSIFTGGIASIVSLWDKVTGAAQKAKEETAKLAEETAKAADAARIDKLTEAYRKLGEQIANATKERQRANELEDMQTSEADKLEDENAKLEKAQKLAALDPNDPAYEEKKRQIENAYEVDAAKRSVARTRRDAETKERREYDEAEAKHGEATEKEFSLIADREELRALRRKANEARAKSTQENEFDVKTLAEGFVNNLKSILSFDGEHFWSDRTAKGDEERKRQEEEAKRYDKQAKALEKRIKEKEDEIADISAEATQHSKKAGIYGMSAANTAIAQEAAEVTGAQSTAAADKAVADKERRLADAKAAATALKEEQSRIKQQIADEQAKKDAANLSVYNAQGDYDLTVANGGKRSAQSSALQNIQAAQTAAQNVNHEADSAINALTETLKNVEARLKAAQSAIQNASKQQNYAWSESPSGT